MDHKHGKRICCDFSTTLAFGITYKRQRGGIGDIALEPNIRINSTHFYSKDVNKGITWITPNAKVKHIMLA